MSKSRPLTERFWEKVSITSGCWLWKGARHPFGYGMIGKTRSNSITTAHRVCWELCRGPIPTGLQVLHRCDNPPCVNPNHLFLGTQKDNMMDCTMKKRIAYGQRVSSTKLNERDVVTIRQLSKSGISYQKIANEFDISIATAWMAIKRRNWKHVQ